MRSPRRVHLRNGGRWPARRVQVRDLLSFERILLLHSTKRSDVPVMDVTFDGTMILALLSDCTILKWSWKAEGAYKEDA